MKSNVCIQNTKVSYLLIFAVFCKKRRISSSKITTPVWRCHKCPQYHTSRKLPEASPGKAASGPTNSKYFRKTSNYI